jgi:hypothetical protein
MWPSNILIMLLNIFIKKKLFIKVNLINGRKIYEKMDG